MKAPRNPAARARSSASLGISGLLLVIVAGCTGINYQDRARTPLKPMVSVVHSRSKDFDIPPKVLEGTRPEYPALEADRREKGFVSIICTIGADGSLREFAIEQMTSPVFAVAALDAIQKWRFSPALKDGHPVEGKVRVPMHFNTI